MLDASTKGEHDMGTRQLKPLLWAICVGLTLLNVSGGAHTRSLRRVQAAAHDLLKVCIVTNDFWGLPYAGGTATAYHLLADVLATDQEIALTFLGVTKEFELCEAAKAKYGSERLRFECLEQRHFEPEVVATYPYEQLSHAALAWMQEHQEACELVHGHEWGGVLVDIVTVSHFRHLQPGTRVAIEPHGGHLWSLHYKLRRQLSVEPLRIDHMERMVSQLNDVEISPSSYMLAFLQQRGWQLPQETLIIPNVLPNDGPHAPAAAEVPVWRLTFFGRLEGRKGIKLFAEALDRLAGAVSELPAEQASRLEVEFVGSETYIEYRKSGEWVQGRAATWPWPTHVRSGLGRAEALEAVSAPGVLLIFCSLVDNLPYVVAEAALRGIPFLTTDVGGVSELFDARAYPDSVVPDPTAHALAQRMQAVLARGSLAPVTLLPAVTGGAGRWLDFHATWAHRLPELRHEDGGLGRSLEALSRRELYVSVRGLDIWDPICGGNVGGGRGPGRVNRSATLLLMPEGYELLEGPQQLPDLARLLHIGKARDSRVGALTFGVALPGGKRAFATAPTWLLHTGDTHQCFDDVPVLIRSETFCKVYLAEARLFRTYHSWLLAMLLGQHSLQMHTYPQVVFSSGEFKAARGFPDCSPLRLPERRRAESAAAALTAFRDAEQALRFMQLGQFGKPLMSLNADFPSQQRQQGWQFGFIPERDAHAMQPLVWIPEDARWGCANRSEPYPSIRHGGMHPCVAQDGHCCGGSNYGAAVMRFESYFHAPGAMLSVGLDAYPYCGDGLDIQIEYRPMGDAPRQLFNHAFNPDPDHLVESFRHKVEAQLDISAGDVLELLLLPRDNDACDGFGVLDVEIWPASH